MTGHPAAIPAAGQILSWVIAGHHPKVDKKSACHFVKRYSLDADVFGTEPRAATAVSIAKLCGAYPPLARHSIVAGSVSCNLPQNIQELK